MGRKLTIDWHETASILKELYRKEQNVERKIRLQVLWQLRLGESLKTIAQQVGMAYRTLQNWVAWYRNGGLTEVLRRIKGHGKQGCPTKLKTCQQKALVAKVALGNFRTIWDVLEWVKARWQVKYSYEGLRKRLKQLKCGLKVPRPCSVEVWSEGASSMFSQS